MSGEGDDAGRPQGGPPPARPAEAASVSTSARSGSRGARRRRVALLAAAAAAVAVVAVVLSFLLLSGSNAPSRAPRAAIVDQLSLTFPNPEFVEAATDLLEQAGYAVDYYPGEEVTVDFYRDLPAAGYEFVVLRSHSARQLAPDRTERDDVTLFTSDLFISSRYPEHLKAGHLGAVGFGNRDEGDPLHFGVRAGFIEEGTRGRFKGATVILLGCDGLRSEAMAQAFVEKGARTFVSWDESVSASHNDAAAERLLRHMIVDGLSAAAAVELTMAEVGPDPAHGAALRVYPPDG